MAGSINLKMNLNNKGYMKGLSRSKKATNGFVNIVKQLSVAAVAGFAALGAMAIKAAAELQTLSVSFEILLGSAEESKKVVKGLFDFAAKTPFMMAGIAGAAKQLIAARGSAEGLQEELKILGDISAVTGKDIGEMAKIYTKAFNKNKLQAEELNQIAEAGIPIMRILADMYGVTTSEIFKMGEKGILTFKDLKAAFKQMTSDGGIAFNAMQKQSETLAGSWSTLKENFTLAMAKLGQNVIPLMTRLINDINTVLKGHDTDVTLLLEQVALKERMNELTEAVKEQEHVMKSADLAALWTTLTTSSGRGQLIALRKELKRVTNQWEFVKAVNVGRIAKEIQDGIDTIDPEPIIELSNALARLEKVSKMAPLKTGKIDNVGSQEKLDTSRPEGAVVSGPTEFLTEWEKSLDAFATKWKNTFEFAGDVANRLSSLIADGMQNSMNQLTASQEQERNAAEESGANKEQLNALDKRHAKEREARAKKAAKTHKNLALAQALIQAALAQLNVWGDKGNGNFYTRLAQSIAVGALTGLEVAVISGVGFAQGTSFAPQGMAMVGERGPELVSFSGGEKVFSNGMSKNMMGGGTLRSAFQGDEMVVWLEDQTRKHAQR